MMVIALTLICIVVSMGHAQEMNNEGEVDFSKNPFINDSRFILTNENNWDIQRYVESILAFRLPARTDSGVAATIRNSYFGWEDGALYWKDYIYPETVNYGAEIDSFGTSAVSIFEEVNVALDKDPVNTTEGKELLADLKLEVNGVAHIANELTQRISSHADHVDMDKTLATYLANQYVAQLVIDNGEDLALVEKMSDLQTKIEDLNTEYEAYQKDKDNAPKYMWIWPWGTLAGAIEINTANEKMDEINTKRNEILADIALIEAEIEKEENEMIVYSTTMTPSLINLSDKMKNTERVFRKILGIWTLLSSTIEVARDKFESYSRLRTWNMNAAIAKWKQVSQMAKVYTDTANIRVER